MSCDTKFSHTMPHSHASLTVPGLPIVKLPRGTGFVAVPEDVLEAPKLNTFNTIAANFKSES